MNTPLLLIGEGRYRHGSLGVEVRRTSTGCGWTLAGPGLDDSKVVLVPRLSHAYAFLRAVETRLQLRRDALLEIHRYLFPERYKDVPTYQWHAGTLPDIVDILARALADDPEARLSTH